MNDVFDWTCDGCGWPCRREDQGLLSQMTARWEYAVFDRCIVIRCPNCKRSFERYERSESRITNAVAGLIGKYAD